MRKTVFSPSAIHEYNEWALFDRKNFLKITKLLYQISRTPFEGEGQPEALKGNFSGYWSRRINQKDRIIYKVLDNEIEIFSCKGHYDDK